MTNDIAYIGIKGCVVAVDVATGRECWRRQLRNSSITNVAVVGKMLLIYARGHLYGLSKENGQVLWENSLSGLGYGYAIFGVEGGQGAALAGAAAAQQQQAIAAAAAASAAAAAANS